MTNELLTPLQAAFLERFFASQVGQRFFLTGGTALAAFHLHHRRSEDLDLFTLDDLALREADILVRRIAAQLSCRIGRARQTEQQSVESSLTAIKPRGPGSSLASWNTPSGTTSGAT